MATNLWERFTTTLPGEPKIIATVLVAGSMESVVETASGGRMRVIGGGFARGSKVWVQDNTIIGAAPDLPHTELEI